MESSKMNMRDSVRALSVKRISAPSKLGRTVPHATSDRNEIMVLNHSYVYFPQIQGQVKPNGFI